MASLNMSSRRTYCVAWSLSACLLFLGGCGQAPEITEYTAPKKDEASRPFTCDVPKDWKLAPNDRFSDLAFECATGVKMTVSSLGGTGDEFLLMNVNRWRRQVSLPPVESLQEMGKAELRNAEGKLVEVASDDKAVKGAIIERGDKTWFFKLSGPVAAVADQSDEFSDFLKSVEFFEINRS
ncbi:MAG: hypothetical protein AB8G99_17340 [Planctomycetaceae bacterium]